MKIVALAGGVGGAKLADGLSRILSPADLTIIVNTGDDFEHLGLSISPDLDTVCYTLAGIANPETGWGRLGDTYNFMEQLQKLGGPTWFRLGDLDLATHIERTRRLKSGDTLSKITNDFCQAWGVRHPILPMSDQPIHTIVETIDEGKLPFQEYFVHRRCEPRVKGFEFSGSQTANPATGLLESIEAADAVVFCPSNPWVSIDPILSVKNIRAAIMQKRVVAVSPIINGKTIKGPAAKMYHEMGIQPSATAVAHHYADLLSGFILDTSDQATLDEIHTPSIFTDIIMSTSADRLRLAQDVLNLIKKL
jgi:LPPG:FO 2-phospho-L-lactate transferase